ncbi:hypothetical protein DL96DRAFT_1824732 [Flagelloscypha sp. PMI_526]|nr:hypothetical protein DL96DRAFT_1824732 [Flagelloscypha sp. PMI_526]
MKLFDVVSILLSSVLVSSLVTAPAPQPGPDPLTNGQRLRLGRPPAPPRRLYDSRHPHPPRASPGAGENCTVRAVRVDSSNDLGYIAQNLGPYLLPTYTTDKTAAARYVCPTHDVSQREVLQVDPPDPSHPYFAPYYGTSNYEIFGTTGHTDPGSTKQQTGSTRSSVSEAESSVFFWSSVNNQLSVTWVEDDGITITPLLLYYFGSDTSGYFMGAEDPVAFQATFPTAIAVTFVMEVDA